MKNPLFYPPVEKGLEPNQAIVCWYEPIYNPDCIENPDYELVFLFNEDGKAYSNNVERAHIFSVKDAHEAILKFRNLYQGQFTTIPIYALGYIPKTGRTQE